MNKNREALETISLRYSQGVVSSDLLIKACNAYKRKEKIFDNEDYDIMVSKSLMNQLHNLPTSDLICKAIVPGQTKYFDGVLYVYSATKNGSKTEYAWHVAKTNVGKNAQMDDKTAKASAKVVNELFPTDIDSVSVVKRLGGSTGAQLVKDVNGNEYVMKKVDKSVNPNGNTAHVRSEYMANMLYNILGQRTPDFELYNADSDDITLLSKFIPGTREPNSNDFAKMGEGFISDVLLANWDIYQNDNCRIDIAGNVIRVDNGGSLAFRAQGTLKQPPFDGDVMSTYKSMLKYNSYLATYLTPENLLKQIDDALAKKDDVIAFLKESGENDLAKIFAQRLDGLKGIKQLITDEVNHQNAVAAAKKGKIAPRTLLDDTQMYRTLSDKEIDDVWNEVKKISGDDGLWYQSGEHGWELLSKICELRGFNARPRVVSENDFWKEAKKSDMPIMFRGNASDGRKTAEEYCDLFRYSDDCHYGKYGIWGQGIYAHTDDTNNVFQRGRNKYNKNDDVNNDSNQGNYKTTQAYHDAQSYANKEKNGILKLAWEPEANVINLVDLFNQIKNNPPKPKNPDPETDKQIKELQETVASIKTELTQLETKLRNYTDEIKKIVHEQEHYDEKITSDVCKLIEDTDWGNRAANNKYTYPSFDTFVKEIMAKCIEKNGGDVEINQNGVSFSLNGANMSIARHSWENNAIKQKNSFTKPYHYQAELFKTFIETNCISRVNKAYDAYLKKNGGAIRNKLVSDINSKESELDTAQNKLDDIIENSTQDNSVYTNIYKHVSKLSNDRCNGNTMSLVGIYAALKGYDGIYVHNGNDSNHGFNIILNRSKVIASIQ